jgi:hypothetical protein
MYKEFETKTSYKYLQEVIKSLDEPVCILGGWAVFFHVNAKFMDEKGSVYLGSRDIDLGFHMAGDLDKCALASSIKVLTDKLGFKHRSFRLVKEIHTETGEDIKDNYVPMHFLFPMYVDPIVDRIPEGFRKTFGFDPVDEPLLKHVFDAKDYTPVKEFGRKLLLPSPEVLLAMKLNSCPQRDKEHKRIKDLCDAFAIIWYTGMNLEKTDLLRFIPKQKLRKFSKTITDEDYAKAAIQLNHSAAEIKRVIEAIISTQQA